MVSVSGTIVVLLTALLANVSILFVARDEVSEAALTDVQEALMSLLAPLGWDNPYIPYVPIGIIQSRPGFVLHSCCLWPVVVRVRDRILWFGTLF